MRREIRLQRSACEEIWNTPLAERIEKGYSLGPLEVTAVSRPWVTLRPANNNATWAEPSLREGDFVCLSEDTPFKPTGHFIYLDEDDEGIHLMFWKGDLPSTSGSNWVIDPDFYDMSTRFAEAIEALATTKLGREKILPLLMGETQGTINAESYDKVIDELDQPDDPDDPSWHDSQQEAIAACVAANDAYLVQGPPGTGKTRVLTEVARRLIDRGERLLLTGPTHRAINHALAGLRQVLPASLRVVKIGMKTPAGETFECYEDLASSGLMESGDPYVIGATPHSLFGNYSGLRETFFDTVLMDEASQLTPLLAAMAMLRGERWLFFGDDCQLPPVVLGDNATPPRERSVFGRLKNRGFDTLLEETWRLNRPLAEWPSATFYYNRLTCRHDRRLHLSPPSRLPALAADPAIVLLEGEGSKRTTVRADEEAQLVVDLVREAVRGGLEPERIGVITPFRAQAARIRRVLAIDHETAGLQRRVTVDTIERYQGQERDLILVSLAASDPRFIRLRADFLFQAERWNVAVTRTRLKTVVLASPGLLKTAESLADDGHEGATCFASLINHLRRHTC